MGWRLELLGAIMLDQQLTAWRAEDRIFAGFEQRRTQEFSTSNLRCRM
jgi:hypothetical protein